MTSLRFFPWRAHLSGGAVAGLLGLASLTTPGCGPGERDLVIVNARIVDGSGSPAEDGAVRVRGGRIIEVGTVQPRDGDEVVDAAGLVLAPGFVDTHSHHDRGLHDERSALGAVSQGITTIVVGQDGSSNLPLVTFFRRLEEEPVAVNVASYAGHGSIRLQVMGDDFRREATEDEVAEMARLLQQEMEAGALGVSTGLEYDPGIYSSTEEVLALARVARAYDGRYISHIRSEDRAFWDAVEELILIGREAEIPVQISHIKLAMHSFWGEAERLVARLEQARSDGVEVTADIYPYRYWQSTLTVLFPERDFEDLEAARFALDEISQAENLLISRFAPDPQYEGLTLAQVAEGRGVEPARTLLDLIAESAAARAAGQDGGESVIGESMHEEDIARLLTWEHTNISSDGGLQGGHPRGFGAFPRVLSHHVRERGDLTLEEAIHRMSALGARHVGLEDRGVIRPGAAADLVLLDPDGIRDRATPQEPQVTAEGIERVWVNGVQVYGGGRTTGSFPGKVLRRQVSAPTANGTDPSASNAAAPNPGSQDAAMGDHGRRSSTPGDAPALLFAGSGPPHAPAPSPGSRDTATALEARIDAVFSEFDNTRSPGCALGVVQHGDLTFARGYGMANLEYGIGIRPTSIFRIASVSKHFTAATMLVLEREGVLSVDDDVRRFIPDLPDYGEPITIRHLIYHTSGMRDYLTLMSLAGKSGNDVYGNLDALGMITRQQELNFPPGQEYLYSNSGYFLLSQIVLRATGATLREYAQARVLEPMGLLRTHFHDDPTGIVEERATGYAPRRNGGYRIDMTMLPMVGDGGIFTNIEEMALWEQVFVGPLERAGDPDLARYLRTRMHERAILTNGDTLDYSFGLRHDVHRGVSTVGHGGSFAGYRADVTRAPDHGLSVTVLCNVATADPARLGREVMEIYLEDHLEPETPAGGTPSGVHPQEEDPLGPALTERELLGFAGSFRSEELAVVYRLEVEDARVVLARPESLARSLDPQGTDTFRAGPYTFRFQRDEGGRVSGFHLDAGRVRNLRFERAAEAEGLSYRD